MELVESHRCVQSKGGSFCYLAFVQGKDLQADRCFRLSIHLLLGNLFCIAAGTPVKSDKAPVIRSLKVNWTSQQCLGISAKDLKGGVVSSWL